MSRRKSYEISTKEQLAKIPKSEWLALEIKAAADGGLIDFVGAMTRPRERFRTQNGETIQYADGIYLRYHIDGKGVDRTGKTRRVKTSEFLCDLGPDKKEVEKLKAKRMKVINLQQKSEFFAPTTEQVTVAQFFDALYYPSVVENKSWSTAQTYKRVWDGYLKAHFEKQSLEKYSVVDANNFLESLAKRKLRDGKIGLGRSSLNLCRAICYGIFKRARAKGMVAANPFEDVDPDVKVRRPKKAVVYTLPEALSVIKAIPRLDAKLLFSFCSLLAMRPSEAAAVKWSDIDLAKSVLRLSRNAPRGHEQEDMKTESSVRPLAIIPPVAWLIERYQEECRKERRKLEGYLFKRRGDSTVIDVSDFAQYHVAPYGKKAIGERWAGLYAGRRCVGTALYNLTGDTRATYQVLGNKKGYNYIEANTEQGRAGMQLLAAEIAKLSE